MKTDTKNKKRCFTAGSVISHLAVLIWMMVIFCFTAQNGDESGDLSSGVTHLVMTVFNQLFQLEWSQAELLEMVSIWDYPIRKLAHMTEFGILAVLIFVTIKYYRFVNTTKKRYLYAWLVAVVYAATDEFHQLFVPGRSGNLFDVCVDASGALIAMTFVYIVSMLYKRIIRA